MSRKKHKKSPVAVICSVLGTALLIILILGCLPLTVPKLMGYHIYTVVSGSMEPAIPTGSLVYIKYSPPEEVKEKEVIAFYSAMDGASIITHRVEVNNTNMGQFLTKGDANEERDMNPIPYDNYIGKVVKSFPRVGGIAQTVTTGSGRIVAVCVIGFAILLEIIGAFIESRNKEED
ncbi:MAG: signal peptidase I [Clostridia bacterium]|nr:signal peptidase I [Clostridia bacterium]NCC42393.1 signal peptidase I [Clostridia bacterium]